MRLVHYSDQPFGELCDIQHGERGDFYKPHGLWVSVDDANYSWRDWCIDTQVRLDALTHVHDVELADGANVLVLSDSTSLDAFTCEFRQFEVDGDMQIFARTYGMNWSAVRERWDGLIITPYLWECRLEPSCMWYYAWDCASGCLWHRRAIASVRLREIVPEPSPIEG